MTAASPAKRTRKRAPALAPRKQPLQQRAAQTIEILVEAAARVLESAGLEGFNTNAIAERAGVSVGSLYQYFPGKDGLIVALMRREDERFFGEAVEALQHGDDGRTAMSRYIDVAVRQQLARPRLARLLDIEEGRPELQRALKGSKNFRPMLEDLLSRADLPVQANPALAALDVGAIIRGLTDAAGERGETDLDHLARRITAAVFGYLKKMDSTPTRSPVKASKKSLSSPGRA